MHRGMQILSPNYLQNANWLYHENEEAKWTPEENKRFENALAVYDKDTPDRWVKVAALLPGKTVGDVIKQYKALEEDVSVIEAGGFPLSGYSTDSFPFELVNNQALDAFKLPYYYVGEKRGTSTRASEQERKKGVPWTEDEHRKFLMGLQKYGKGDWRNIARNFVTTRTPTQVASHAQKFYIRQHTGGKDKRRSSIHDITTVNNPSTNSPSHDNGRASSPDPFTKAMQPQQHPKLTNMVKQQLDWKSPSDSFSMILSPTNSNPFIGSFCGIPCNGSKLQEQNLLGGGNLRGSQLGPHSTFYEMQHQ